MFKTLQGLQGEQYGDYHILLEAVMKTSLEQNIVVVQKKTLTSDLGNSRCSRKQKRGDVNEVGDSLGNEGERNTVSRQYG